MPRHKQRMPLELGLALNVNELLREGFIEPGQSSPPKDCHWLDDDGGLRATAVISASTTIRPSATGYGEMHVVANWIDQTIRLAAQPRHFGGWQWYFVCPRANQRVSVLWSPPGKRFFAGRCRYLARPSSRLTTVLASDPGTVVRHSHRRQVSRRPPARDRASPHGAVARRRFGAAGREITTGGHRNATAWHPG